MRSRLIFVLISAIIMLSFQAEVIDLTSQNFDSIIKSNDFVFVLFYVNFFVAARNNVLVSNLEQAAKASLSNVVFGKVQCNTNSDLCQSQQIVENPQIRFYLDDTYIQYKGGVEFPLMLNWIDSHLNTDKKIVTSDEFDRFMLGRQSHVLAYFPDATSPKIRDDYVHVSRHFEDTLFAETSTASVIEHAKNQLPHLKRLLETKQNWNVTPIIISLYQDEYREESNIVEVGEFASYPTMDALHDYVRSVRFPFVSIFNHNTMNRFLFDGRPLLIIFSRTNEDIQAFYELSQQKKYREKLLFIKSGIVEPIEKSLMELVAIEDTTDTIFPTIRILTTDGKGRLIQTQKYKLEERITSKNDIQIFIDAYLNNQLTPYLRSEPIYYHPIYPGRLITAVGQSFKKLVYDKNYDVLVFYYAPWCGHCVALHPVYGELASKFNTVKTVRIVKIDATRNEIPNHIIHSYPTIIFYPAKDIDEDNPSMTAVQYTEHERTVKSFVHFIHQNAVHKFDANAILNNNGMGTGFGLLGDQFVKEDL